MMMMIVKCRTRMMRRRVRVELRHRVPPHQASDDDDDDDSKV